MSVKGLDAVKGLRSPASTVLDRAARRREIPQNVATETLLDLAFGSLWYRLIFDIGPLDQAWADAVTTSLTAAATPRTTASSGPLPNHDDTR